MSAMVDGEADASPALTASTRAEEPVAARATESASRIGVSCTMERSPGGGPMSTGSPVMTQTRSSRLRCSVARSVSVSPGP